MRVCYALDTNRYIYIDHFSVRPREKEVVMFLLSYDVTQMADNIRVLGHPIPVSGYMTSRDLGWLAGWVGVAAGMLTETNCTLDLSIIAPKWTIKHQYLRLRVKWRLLLVT